MTAERDRMAEWVRLNDESKRLEVRIERMQQARQRLIDRLQKLEDEQLLASLANGTGACVIS